MSQSKWFTLFLLMGIVVSASCSARQSSPLPSAGMANPASVYCEEQGGKVVIRTAADGSQSGACVFPDGSECEEWAYFRGECKPGETPAQPEPTGATIQTRELAGDGCRVYRNEELGYSFHYPADAELSVSGAPADSVSIVGPLTAGEHWPQITISHPSDRPDYQPPEGTRLREWLANHNLLGEQELPEVQIAGTTAIHLRHERSPQSYANDRYYFARSGRLYEIVIEHAGDKEDWDLYNHFLASIEFLDLSDCPCNAHATATP